MPTLHIHLDESGDLSFTPKGSKYYIFAAAWTFDPAPLAHRLINLRFQLLSNGHDISCFHATEDQQRNRNAVTNILCSQAGWAWAAIVIEKAKVNPSIRDPPHFYPKFASMLLRFVLRGRRGRADKVLIYTDTLPLKSQKEAAEKAIKVACRAELPNAIPFQSYHHPSASNCWLQVADYCAWATFKKWEKKDMRTYNTLTVRLPVPEIDILRKGLDLYY